MILTDYYKGENLPECKKTRYNVTASTGSYEYFETKLKTKTGCLAFYFGDVPPYFRFAGNDKPDKAITKGDNISSVFVPDVTLPFGFGDVKNTSDAILLIFSKDWQTIEIFIARGQRNNKRNLYHLLCDGELDHDIEKLRTQAKN
jgi:hypothetical protein